LPENPPRRPFPVLQPCELHDTIGGAQIAKVVQLQSGRAPGAAGGIPPMSFADAPERQIAAMTGERRSAAVELDMSNIRALKVTGRRGLQTQQSLPVAADVTEDGAHFNEIRAVLPLVVQVEA